MNRPLFAVLGLLCAGAGWWAEGRLEGEGEATAANLPSGKLRTLLEQVMRTGGN